VGHLSEVVGGVGGVGVACKWWPIIDWVGFLGRDHRRMVFRKGSAGTRKLPIT